MPHAASRQPNSFLTTPRSETAQQRHKRTSTTTRVEVNPRSASSAMKIYTQAPDLHSKLREHVSAQQKQRHTMAIDSVLNKPDDESQKSSSLSPTSNSSSPGNPDSSRSSSPDQPNKPREFRSPYQEEQHLWIWFFRIDMRRTWDEVAFAYNRYWHPNERYVVPEDAPRKKGGLQCKLYRVLENYNLPQVREQEQTSDGLSPFSMWLQVGKQFPWMDPYADLLPGQWNTIVFGSYFC